MLVLLRLGEVLSRLAILEEIVDQCPSPAKQSGMGPKHTSSRKKQAQQG